MHLVLTILIILPHFTFALSTTASKQISGAYVFALNKSLLQQRRRRLLSPPSPPYCCPTNVVMCDTNVVQQLLANICLSCVCGFTGTVLFFLSINDSINQSTDQSITNTFIQHHTWSKRHILPALTSAMLLRCCTPSIYKLVVRLGGTLTKCSSYLHKQQTGSWGFREFNIAPSWVRAEHITVEVCMGTRFQSHPHPSPCSLNPSPPAPASTWIHRHPSPHRSVSIPTRPRINRMVKTDVFNNSNI